MLKFTTVQSVREALFTVSVEDIHQAIHGPHEKYADCSPLRRALSKHAVRHRANHVTLQTSDGLIEAHVGTEAYHWDGKAINGQVEGPTQFCILQRGPDFYQILPTVTGDFLLEHYSTGGEWEDCYDCLLYTSPSPRD